MRKVFVADKHSYGAEFFVECNSLIALEKAIVEHEERWEKEKLPYSEELFKELSVDYILYEVDLHDSEQIVFSEYDGSSRFKIEKKVSNLLSTKREIGRDE